MKSTQGAKKKQVIDCCPVASQIHPQWPTQSPEDGRIASHLVSIEDWRSDGRHARHAKALHEILSRGGAWDHRCDRCGWSPKCCDAHTSQIMRPPTVWHPFHTWMASVIGKHMFVLMYNYEHWVPLHPLSWWKWLWAVYDWVCARQKDKESKAEKVWSRKSINTLLTALNHFLNYTARTQVAVCPEPKSQIRCEISSSMSPPHFPPPLFRCYTGSRAGNVVIIQEAWGLPLTREGSRETKRGAE